MISSEAASGIRFNDIRIAVVQLLCGKLTRHLGLITIQIFLEASLKFEDMLFLQLFHFVNWLYLFEENRENFA